MKVLIDMNLSPRLCDSLAVAGIEATHWSAIGAENAPDRQIMAYAKDHDFIVLTHDLDYAAMLAATNAGKPSVVLIRAADLTPELLASAVVAGLRQCEQALALGALLTIDPARLRLRLLPLNVE
jgi:predicted nuclease of predicted toxin-antitoxin system